MRTFSFFVAGFLVLISACQACADNPPYPGQDDAVLPKRLALVIGVETYGDVGGEVVLTSLPDAKKDAQDFAKILPSFGFDVTLLTSDEQQRVDKKTIQAAIKDFREKAKLARDATNPPRAPILLFYFSGHGFAADGGSYLIPSDFYADDLYSFQTNSISLLRDVVHKLELDFQPALQIIITDACRSPIPVNIPSRSGQKAALPGSADPNSGRIRPAQAELGKNRSVFLFSTLDRDPAYGTAGVGGRFTNALLAELADALKNAKPPPAAPVTLENIFSGASTEMDTNGSSKWQKPAYDPTWGAPFQLLPFAETFRAEKEAFEGVKLEGSEPTTAMRGYACTLRSMLKTFSEFSYFSQKIIDNLIRLGPVDCRSPILLGGGVNGVAAPPVRDDQARWNVPALAVQPAGVRGDAEPLSRSPRYGDASRNGTTPADAIKSRLNALAQLDKASPSTGSAPASGPPEIKPTFGDIKSAIVQQGSPQRAGQLPSSDVPLDQAVVAKTDLFLRALPGAQSSRRTSIPAGEILQVLGTSTGRTWLHVKHVKLGSGYVSGDLVEPALMTVSKAVTFGPKQYDLDDAIKNDLTSTFALLGGMAIVDGYVEFPETTNVLEFTRASVTAKFITQLATQADASKKSSLYISVRPYQPRGSADSLPPNSVRLVMLGLPLDANVRAQLAQTHQSGLAIKLESLNAGQIIQTLGVPPVEASTPEPRTPEGSPTVGVKFCSPDGRNCSLSRFPTDVDKANEKAARDAGKTIDKAVQDTGGTGTKMIKGGVMVDPTVVNKLGTLFKF